jgi:hypothetical protein
MRSGASRMITAVDWSSEAGVTNLSRLTLQLAHVKQMDRQTSAKPAGGSQGSPGDPGEGDSPHSHFFSGSDIFAFGA